MDAKGKHGLREKDMLEYQKAKHYAQEEENIRLRKNLMNAKEEYEAINEAVASRLPEIEHVQEEENKFNKRVKNREESLYRLKFAAKSVRDISTDP
ncbi:hypothetical protein RclHR1_06810006 [Rhizophagus clarus]|uniref:Uncharacterized protein n=1 Tax=Rhizophagus clarus TaxID=94130 RepID=A0A2Z6SJK7_9GLOM|nr:hypothetical protein RclHR1_06810006 [Rhizophagus clarus]